MSGIGTTAIVEINQLANTFQSSIVLREGNRHIDVKSILGLSLTLVSHEEYTLEIHGADESDAKAALVSLFQKHGLRVTVVE